MVCIAIDSRVRQFAKHSAKLKNVDDREDKLAERSGPIEPPATKDDDVAPTQDASSDPISVKDNPERPPPEPQ